MKKINKIFWAIFLGSIIFVSCDPNKDLYNQMDKEKEPYNEHLEYTLTEADYGRFEGFIEDYNAFSDSFPAMDYIPDILKIRFPTLNLESSAMVTYNYFLMHPYWWDSGFGYELKEENYQWMGAGMYFTPENPAKNHVPDLLNINPDNLDLDEIEDPEEEDQINIIYNFRIDGEELLYLDTYEFDGDEWIWVETTEDIPYVGYEFTEEDYESFGGDVANYQNFSEDYPPENYIPVFLSNYEPYATGGDVQVVKYRYYDGDQTTDVIDKYYFDGANWKKESYVEERSEQYVFGELGWAFDPTVRYTMRSDDYMYITSQDPIGQQELPWDDFGYYYGASAYYSNFDIRLIGRRLDKLESGEYADPELAEIHENEGREAAIDEMMRRIVEEGIIALLQHKYPHAKPEVEGIAAHFFVSFETFGDNWVRTYPTAEYICTEAGDPPQFEFKELKDDDDED